jgi:hypothetical protein
MDYYIVRIYRRDERNEQNMVGLVETVGLDGKSVFKNQDELWRILRNQVDSGARLRVKRMGSEVE